MKRAAVVTTVILALSLAAAGVAVAQGGVGPGPTRGSGARNYDPKTVETASGTVLKVEQVSGKGRRSAGGVHLLLRTDREEIAVHLGPAAYVDEQAVKIAVQDTIEVRGSRITFEGKPAIIAAQVKKGEQILKLRDDSGTPLWR